ncbi:MAG: hypothetical protein NVSMB65_20860 [Chloroflexota bacterium]
MSTTDGYRETSGSAALGPADLDMATLEDVTAAARRYAQATDRLAGAYTDCMLAVRTLAAAQQAVHDAAQALTTAEHVMQEGGRLAHTPQQPAPATVTAAPRAAEAYAPPRAPEPAMTPKVESDHDYAPSPEDDALSAAADRDEAPSTSVGSSAVPATPLAYAAEEVESAAAPEAQADAPAAPPPSPEGGLKVIPRFLGNPPPARLSQP